jgi:hypothetical protein
LETPIDRPGDDRRNVAKLWELAGLKAQAPPVEKGFSMLTPAVKRKMEALGSHPVSRKKIAQSKEKNRKEVRPRRKLTSRKKRAGRRG